MGKQQEQITRIRQMERRLNTALAAVKRLTTALDKWEAAQEAIAALDEYYGSEAALKLFDQNWIPKRYPKARKAIISEHQKMYELCVDREFDEYERATKALTFSISKLSSIIDFGDSISDVLEDARARTKARAKLPIKRYIFIIIRTVILLYIIGVIIASIQAGELRLLF